MAPDQDRQEYKSSARASGQAENEHPGDPQVQYEQYDRQGRKISDVGCQRDAVVGDGATLSQQDALKEVHRQLARYGSQSDDQLSRGNAAEQGRVCETDEEPEANEQRPSRTRQ